jgi:hypothetical protein
MNAMIGRTAPATAYKFFVGQRVQVIPIDPDRWMAVGEYVVTEQFCRDEQAHYCVKSPREPYERVVTESQLYAAIRNDAPPLVSDHPVPQFLLDRWASDGQVTSYHWDGSRQTTQSQRVSARAACRLMDGDAFRGACPTEQAPHQRFFAAQVDPAAENALNAMLDQGVTGLTVKQRNAWARLIASFAARTSEPRCLLAQHWEAIGPLDSECSAASTIELPADSENVSAIIDMTWWLRRFEGKTILTSDRPLLSRPRTEQPCGLALNDTDCLIFLPVSPNTVFFATGNAKVHAKTRNTPKGKLVNMVNEEVVWRSAEYVFAPNASMATFIRDRMVGKRSGNWRPQPATFR